MKALEAEECMPIHFDLSHNNLLTCCSTLRQNLAMKLPETCDGAHVLSLYTRQTLSICPSISVNYQMEIHSTLMYLCQ
jgi:hypothetical protein